MKSFNQNFNMMAALTLPGTWYHVKLRVIVIFFLLRVILKQGNHTFWDEYWRYIDSVLDKVVHWNVWKSNGHTCKLSFRFLS